MIFTGICVEEASWFSDVKCCRLIESSLNETAFKMMVEWPCFEYVGKFGVVLCNLRALIGLGLADLCACHVCVCRCSGSLCVSVGIGE